MGLVFCLDYLLNGFFRYILPIHVFFFFWCACDLDVPGETSLPIFWGRVFWVVPPNIWVLMSCEIMDFGFCFCLHGLDFSWVLMSCEIMDFGFCFCLHGLDFLHIRWLPTTTPDSDFGGFILPKIPSSQNAFAKEPGKMNKAPQSTSTGHSKHTHAFGVVTAARYPTSSFDSLGRVWV